MTRSIDLQDNFSKTKLIERLAEAQRQQALQQQAVSAKGDQEKAARQAQTAQEPQEDYRVKPDGEKKKKFIKKRPEAETEAEADAEAAEETPVKPPSEDADADHTIDLKA